MLFAVQTFQVGLVVGAPTEDSSATGIDGDQGDNGLSFSGAAYVFDLDVTPTPNAWTDQGCALAGISGDPLLVGNGTLVAGSSNSIELSNAAASALTGVFLAPSSTPLSFMGGTLKPFPFVRVMFLSTSASGTISIPFIMPPGMSPGTELWVQWAITDVAAINGVSLSNAILGVTP